MDKIEEGLDYYFNNEGLIVLTGLFHLRRGYCCGNGCLHCPYDFVNVREPKRSELLAMRKPGTSGTKLKHND